MSYDQKLITKTYSIAYASIPANTLVGLGTVDLAGSSFAGTLNNATLVKTEVSWAYTSGPYYVSAELYVYVDPEFNQYIPSLPGSGGSIADYPIGSHAFNDNYSHLLYFDESGADFEIVFDAITPHPQLAQYFQMGIYLWTPNFPGDIGGMITTYYPNHIPSNHDY